MKDDSLHEINGKHDYDKDNTYLINDSLGNGSEFGLQSVDEIESHPFGFGIDVALDDKHYVESDDVKKDETEDNADNEDNEDINRNYLKSHTNTSLENSESTTDADHHSSSGAGNGSEEFSENEDGGALEDFGLQEETKKNHE